ncbi:aldo/keto reductase [Allorhizobium taibaishanense]|uniref:Aryl-alcohol dehydrogenase-like predicted oxidoreductase n=1 Tax=Allorhizobium taibaishanense TaxID=887144 RepID=A0A7W6HSL6_9HYPH|nr:aldo/keto reductase [Allorhizobium taibaishanense]MBB4010092.1 aryl-alcohol dehydrogenase-like predicted oxidoreductase [Allorhizobium taibaishanense]
MTWSPLGGGVLTGKYRKGETGRAEKMGGRVFQAENSEQRTRILDTVLDIAEELETSPDRVAIAWSISHGSIPLIGPRSLDQLKANIGAVSISLSEDQIRRLNEVSSLTRAVATQAVSSQDYGVAVNKVVA